MPFPATVDLAAIAAGIGGFAIKGDGWLDGRHEVSAAGDVNGDGIDDVIFGIVRVGYYGFTYGGAAYVVFGRSDGFANPVDLADIAAGSGGFLVQGEGAYDLVGFSVSAAGDVNGDGIGDLIIGAPKVLDYAAARYDGAAYVVFGNGDGFTSPVDLRAIAAGSGGFRVLGESAHDYAGYSVSAAGDVDGDGVDDLIVGAPTSYFGGVGPGAAYVVFGRTNGFDSPIDLAAIAAGSGGFKIIGENERDGAGVSVAAAGDINGDGIDDLAVGAPGQDSAGGFAGAVYVVFGTLGGFDGPIELAAIASGMGGFRILGENAGDAAGFSVAAAGDINGDGIDDLAVGVPGQDAAGESAGAAYVVFGRTRGFAAPVDLHAIAAGNGGFKIIGENAGDWAGNSVSAAGDVNGDGIDDLIVGAPTNRTDNVAYGAAYVVFGRAGGFSSPIDLADIAAGSGGFKLRGENEGDGAGYAVSAAGDVNGDGLDDLLVGSHHGATYVIFGRREPFVPDGGLFTTGDDLRNLNDLDLAAFSVAEASWARNGDDVVFLSVTQNLGLRFFAGVGNDAVTGSGATDRIDGGAGNDTINGRGGGDTLRGNAGDDSLIDLGGDDTLFGGDGNDRLDNGAGNDRLFGGDGDDDLGSYSYGGDDTLFGGDGNDRLDGDGNDCLFGGNGDDELVSYSYGGDDTLFGGDGNDQLIGFHANSCLFGGDGDDGVDSYGSDNTLFGGKGHDVLSGQENDRLFGGAGNDYLGGEDSGVLAGGNGDDELSYASNGTLVGLSAKLFGGNGDDFIVVYAAEEFTAAGGAGNDVLVAWDGYRPIAGTFILGVGRDVIKPGGHADSPRNLIVDDFSRAGGDVVELALGLGFHVAGYDSNGDGRLTAADAFVRVAGGDLTIDLAAAAHTEGDATVTFRGVRELRLGVDASFAVGGTVRIGTSADETFVGTSANDVLLGLDGDDRLSGGEEDDDLSGGSGDDIIKGGGGTDTLAGGSGRNTLDGGSQADFEADTADYLAATGGVLVNLANGVARPLAGTAFEDRLIGIEGAIGSIFADRINGSARRDLVDVAAGSDLVEGRGGDDTLRGGDGDDTVFGGSGLDHLEGGDGDDRLVGGSGDNGLTGGNGKDTLVGGSDRDFLGGGADNDVLVGGGGHDIFGYFLSDPNVVFAPYVGGGRDVAHDFIRGVDLLNLGLATSDLILEGAEVFDLLDTNDNAALDDADAYVTVTRDAHQGHTRFSTIIEMGKAHDDLEGSSGEFGADDFLVLLGVAGIMEGDLISFS